MKSLPSFSGKHKYGANWERKLGSLRFFFTNLGINYAICVSGHLTRSSATVEIARVADDADFCVKL